MLEPGDPPSVICRGTAVSPLKCSNVFLTVDKETHVPHPHSVSWTQLGSGLTVGLGDHVCTEGT